MTRKNLIKFHRLFNELVQMVIDGRPAYKFRWQPVDYCGGFEVILTSNYVIWDREISTLDAICRSMALSLQIELYNGRILIF